MILNIAVVLLSLWSTCLKNDVSENIRLLYPHNEALIDKFMFKVNNNAFTLIFSNFLPTGVFFVYSCIIPAQFFFSVLLIAGFEKYVSYITRVLLFILGDFEIHPHYLPCLLYDFTVRK